MLTVYHNVNPIINNIQRDEIHNLKNVLNENVNVTKQTSIVDKISHQRALWINFCDHS